MTYWNRVLRAALIGLPGVFAVPLLITPPMDIPRALLAVNPLILLTAMALLGAWAAPKAGLKSGLIQGTPLNKRALTRFALWGVLAGVGVALLDHGTRTFWQVEALSAPPSLVEGASWQQLLLGVTYGGLTEEVLMRFGLMAALLVGFAKLLPRKTAEITAIAISSMLFAAGHLPALFAAGIPAETALLTRILFLNTAVGAWFGWIYTRNDLESAIKAHAGFHVGAFLLGSLIL